MSIMTHLRKSSAAFRVQSLAELTDSGPSIRSDEGAPSPESLRSQANSAATPRNFPKLVEHIPALEPDVTLAQLADLAAELEAALMSDLRSAATLREPEAPQAARLPAGTAPPALPLVQAELEAAASGPPRQSGAELPPQDRLAVELLLARGRRPDAEPKAEAPRTAVALEDRLASELAQRLSIAVDDLRIADGEQPTLDAEFSHPAAAARWRVMPNRQWLAVAAVLVVVGGGALATVYSLAVRPGAPAMSELDGDTIAAVAGADAPVALPAPAAKQSYDRAAESQSLPESPQLRGTDMMETVPGAAPTLGTALLPGSAVSTRPVTSSVRAAYAAPSEEALPAATAIVAPAQSDPAVTGAIPSPNGAATGSASGAPTELTPALAAPTNNAPTNSAASDLGAGPATITSGVRLRGNPDNGAPTIGMLKAGDPVQVVQCKGWCEVVADGKRGFVFKKFLEAVRG